MPSTLTENATKNGEKDWERKVDGGSKRNEKMPHNVNVDGENEENDNSSDGSYSKQNERKIENKKRQARRTKKKCTENERRREE